MEVRPNGKLYLYGKKCQGTTEEMRVSAVPEIRIRKGNDRPARSDGDYVLYWMIAARRLRYNFALDRALEHCAELGKPLLIFEALRVGYPWASDRVHRFVVDGMAENARYCEARGVCYLAYVEPKEGAGKGLLSARSAAACVVVTDEFPCFFLPRMVASAAKQLKVLLEVVDSNGLLPLRATEQVYQRAYDFRRFLQKELPKHLGHFPKADPLTKAKLSDAPKIPLKKFAAWQMVSPQMFAEEDDSLSRLPIDHSVKPVELRGGQESARTHMRKFFEKKFPLYQEHRNEPEADATSGFSPYLHFGHLSVHEVFAELAKREKWKPEKLALRSNGSREGWWNISPAAESFLDELITWREVGYNFSSRRKDYDRYESLPDWAQKTLKDHTKDNREYLYTMAEFEGAKTHDALWNAAQMQLVREGKIHNYLRMLWGKKILEWTKTPQEASRIMIHLNNKYAVDGRNPNSYSGIFWVLGRYDRPWGPERPIFGLIRYMSSENTARKVSVKGYIRKYSGSSSGQEQLAFG
jgi:deoxyribodipyrimidine photo-lyase